MRIKARDELGNERDINFVDTGSDAQKMVFRDLVLIQPTTKKFLSASALPSEAKRLSLRKKRKGTRLR